MDVLLKGFGRLDLKALNEYYEGFMMLNGEMIQMDLNFENKTIDASKINSVEKIFDTIATFDEKNRMYISQNCNSKTENNIGKQIKNYIEKTAITPINSKEVFLEVDENIAGKLQLKRIGFFLNDSDLEMSFDYAIGHDLKGCFVVVHTDKDGSLFEIELEC
ncbi:hypothetical protein ACI6PS_04390 [Flavobacterium sp. PLA-1-15]|uniref:hypothetical protein n=1 Tax=Flavobacterium sp. PLA-1-15 TaxID=3380533 RepID=UPI003B81A60A